MSYTEPPNPLAAADLIERAKKAGLIQMSGQPVDLKKDGRLAIEYHGVKMMVMGITPAMAAEWLERNARNRKVSWDTVDAYARDMRAGNWLVTHQGLAFNKRDELIDGQHRLHAIIRAGVTVMMLVTFGLPRGALKNGMTVMDTVDRGKTRSVADQLKIQHGMQDGSVLAAVCTSIAGICYGQKTKRLSVGQVLEIYERWKPGIDYVIAHRSKAHGLRMAGVLAAFAFAWPAIGYGTDVAAMYRAVVHGTAPDGSPLDRLGKFLAGPDAILLSRSTDRGLIEVVAGAILAAMQGRNDWQLQRDPGAVEQLKAAQESNVEKIARIFTLGDK